MDRGKLKRYLWILWSLWLMGLDNRSTQKLCLADRIYVGCTCTKSNKGCIYTATGTPESTPKDLNFHKLTELEHIPVSISHDPKTDDVYILQSEFPNDNKGQKRIGRWNGRTIKPVIEQSLYDPRKLCIIDRKLLWTDYFKSTIYQVNLDEYKSPEKTTGIPLISSGAASCWAIAAAHINGKSYIFWGEHGDDTVKRFLLDALSNTTDIMRAIKAKTLATFEPATVLFAFSKTGDLCMESISNDSLQEPLYPKTDASYIHDIVVFSNSLLGFARMKDINSWYIKIYDFTTGNWLDRYLVHGFDVDSCSSIHSIHVKGRRRLALKEFVKLVHMLKNEIKMSDILDTWEDFNSYFPVLENGVKRWQSDTIDIELFDDNTLRDNSWTVELGNVSAGYDFTLKLPENAWTQAEGKNIVASVLKRNLTSKKVTGESNVKLMMASNILSLNMYDRNEEKVSYPTESTEAFDVTFNFEVDVTAAISCQFLTANRKWSSEGCNVSEVKTSHVTCSCNHMTSFAVLFQVVEVEISAPNQQALSILTCILLPLSMVCLVATIALFIICKLYKKKRIILHLNLSVSLLLAQLMFICGISTKSKGACIFVTFMLHYLWLVVFMWMLVEGIHMFLKINPTISWEIKLPLWIPIAWVVPAVIAFITLGAGISKYARGRCWLPLEGGLIAAFATPALMITAVNVVFLVLIIRKFLSLKANQDKSEAERFKAGVRAVCILIPILGFTCIFGVLQFDEAATAFAYLFVICNGLQGLFIFVTQCLLDDDVYRFLKMKISRGRVEDQDESNSTENT